MSYCYIARIETLGDLRRAIDQAEQDCLRDGMSKQEFENLKLSHDYGADGLINVTDYSLVVSETEKDLDATFDDVYNDDGPYSYFYEEFEKYADGVRAAVDNAKHYCSLTPYTSAEYTKEDLKTKLEERDCVYRNSRKIQHLRDLEDMRQDLASFIEEL